MTAPETAENNIVVFDRNLIRKRRARFATTIDKHRFLFDWAMEQLLDRRHDIKRNFSSILQIGSRSSPHFDQKFNADFLVKTDITDRLLTTGTGLVSDEEALPFKPQSFDMVISPLTLHNTNDLPGSLIQIKHCLKPDGLFLGALFGENTLHELRHCLMQAELSLKNGSSPRIVPFASKQQMGALLQRAAFALPVVDSERVTVTYDNAFHLMKDIRGMGESNSIHNRSRTPATKALLTEAARLYQEQFSDQDGRIFATFDIIFLIGWAPHQTQQQPLRPGSARHRLSDALDTKEVTCP